MHYWGKGIAERRFFSRAGPWGRILCICISTQLLIPWSYTLASRFFRGVIVYIIVGNTRHGTWDMGSGNNHRDDYEGVE